MFGANKKFSSLATIGFRISSLRAPLVPSALFMDTRRMVLTGAVHTAGNKQPGKGNCSIMLTKENNPKL